MAQCQNFLTESLPNAKRVPVSSTALAALSLLPSRAQEASAPRIRSAAICSSVVADIYPGLKVLRRGIEDKAGELRAPSLCCPLFDVVFLFTLTGNTTRFLLLGISSSRDSVPVDHRHLSASHPAIAHSLVAFSAGLCEVPSLSDVLSSLPGRVLSLDRRPESVRGDGDEVDRGSSDGGGFRSRYLALVELSKPPTPESAVEAQVGNLVVLGTWPAYR